MPLPLKTGIVVVTVLVKHICKVLTKYRPAMNSVIDAAVTEGVITSIQRSVLFTWLDGAQSACDIIRLVSGY